MDGDTAARCDNCRIEIPWQPVISGGKTYCCRGCARNGPCCCSYDADPRPRVSQGRDGEPTARSGKEIARRFFEDVLAAEGDRATDRLIAPGAVVHLSSGRFAGPEGVRRLRASLSTAYSDLSFEVEDVIAEGDRVAARWVLRGTERGELFGVPPSGKPTTITGLSLFRIEGDRIVEHWMAEC